MSDIVRTRFAPSPTGYLHIGGARTALFNYLLARRLGGRFVLRIEDTDQTRNIAEADRRLLDDLRWLGLHWDEGPEVGGDLGPYHQSQRLDRYGAIARQLLDAGRAYYAFETREELDAMRREAQKQKRTFRYPRPERFPSEAEADRARAEGRPVVIRFKKKDRDFVVPDVILGDVRIAAEELDDFVIVKADGWPTYHFAVVVDDEAMGITHVLRGQEHLMNTPNHLGLQEALGYRCPVYAHLPIIFNMDGSKMSKREKDKAVRAALPAALAAGRLDEERARSIARADADTFKAWRDGQAPLDDEGLQALARTLDVVLPEIQIHDFRVSGYLPEVIVNFIGLLGWSPGGDREKMTLDEMCDLFTVDRIGKTNARFDRDKLLSFNTTAMAAESDERRLAGLRDYIQVNGPGPLATLDDETLVRLIQINPGVRTFRDIEFKSAILFRPDEDVTYDADAVKKWLLKGERQGIQVLQTMRTSLAELPDWQPAPLEALIRGYADQHGLGLGKVAQPLRIAVTGSTISPPIFDTLAILGRERTLARIARTLAHVAADES
ncbi:MAG: glutamate--tRNA ligase [Phycisphaerae bacterium]|jgi:glutamyl-tRNA synthetase